MSWETFRQEAGDWAARKWFGGHYKEAYGADEASLGASKQATDAAFESTAAQSAQVEAARVEALRAEVAAYDAERYDDEQKELHEADSEPVVDAAAEAGEQ